MAGAFRRNHENVQVGTRLDQLEMYGQTVCKRQRRTLFQVVAQISRIQVRLQFIGRQDHGDIRPGRRSGRRHHFKPGVFRLGDARGSFTQPDNDFLHAGIVQVICMGVTLAAIANDRDLLVLDKINIRIPVVIYSHRSTFPY